MGDDGQESESPTGAAERLFREWRSKTTAEQFWARFQDDSEFTTQLLATDAMNRLLAVFRDPDTTRYRMLDYIGAQGWRDPELVYSMLEDMHASEQHRIQDKPDTDRGRRTREAAQRGHAVIHGTVEAKQQRWDRQRAAYKAARSKGIAKKAAKLEAAEKCRCSVRAIERAFKYVGESIP